MANVVATAFPKTLAAASFNRVPTTTLSAVSPILAAAYESYTGQSTEAPSTYQASLAPANAQQKQQSMSLPLPPFQAQPRPSVKPSGSEGGFVLLSPVDRSSLQSEIEAPPEATDEFSQLLSTLRFAAGKLKQLERAIVQGVAQARDVYGSLPNDDKVFEDPSGLVGGMILLDGDVFLADAPVDDSTFFEQDSLQSLTTVNLRIEATYGRYQEFEVAAVDERASRGAEPQAMDAVFEVPVPAPDESVPTANEGSPSSATDMSAASIIFSSFLMVTYVLPTSGATPSDDKGTTNGLPNHRGAGDRNRVY